MVKVYFKKLTAFARTLTVSDLGLLSMTVNDVIYHGLQNHRKLHVIFIDKQGEVDRRNKNALIDRYLYRNYRIRNTIVTNWSRLFRQCVKSLHAEYSVNNKSHSVHRIVINLNRGNGIYGEYLKNLFGIQRTEESCGT